MRVELKGISKRFGRVHAVDDVSLTIEEGDFFTLLGPSGCGKTTLLRMVAGFYRPDAGQIRFGDRVVNDVPPHRRETGMVFQNYALFPHLSVFDNIAYGLKARKVARREIAERIGDILKSVQLEGLETRSPNQLSGGQQQRVALARALVISPQILLMDEPLSNLDAKLRVGMREEIRRIQRKLGITTIYVTHDQEEAMAVSDRIAILSRGRLEQLGTPAEVYFRPGSRFSAEFMGNSNILEVQTTGYDEAASLVVGQISGQRISFRGQMPAGGSAILSIRPEWIRLASGPQEEGENLLSGRILGSTFLGSMIRYRVAGPGGGDVVIEVHDPGERDVRREGEILWYRIPPDKPVVLRG